MDYQLSQAIGMDLFEISVIHNADERIIVRLGRRDCGIRYWDDLTSTLRKELKRLVSGIQINRMEDSCWITVWAKDSNGYDQWEITEAILDTIKELAPKRITNLIQFVCSTGTKTRYIEIGPTKNLEFTMAIKWDEARQAIADILNQAGITYRLIDMIRPTIQVVQTKHWDLVELIEVVERVLKSRVGYAIKREDQCVLGL